VPSESDSMPARVPQPRLPALMPSLITFSISITGGLLSDIVQKRVFMLYITTFGT